MSLSVLSAALPYSGSIAVESVNADVDRNGGEIRVIAGGHWIRGEDPIERAPERGDL